MTNDVVPVPPDEPKIREIIQTLEDEARKIGLYLEGASVMLQREAPPEEMAENFSFVSEVLKGETVALATGFAIGEVAFSDRITNPEQFEVDKQARSMLPTEAEALREKLAEAKEQGKDLFDLFDEDEELDAEDED